MTIPEILQELEPYTGKFPMEAMRAAIAQREAITPELLEEVRQAYSEGLVDEDVADLEGIERDMAAPQSWRRGGHALITDAIAEMEGWACFHNDDSGPTEPPEVPVPAPPPPRPLGASRQSHSSATTRRLGETPRALAAAARNTSTAAGGSTAPRPTRQSRRSERP